MAYTDFEAQQDELVALTEILDTNCFSAAFDENEKILSGEIVIHVKSKSDKKFRLVHPRVGNDEINEEASSSSASRPKVSDEQSAIELSHLPPLILKFKCPSDYPSISKPQFSLTSSWLHTKLVSILCGHLDQIWEENIGLGILYLWVDFVQENFWKIVTENNENEALEISTFTNSINYSQSTTDESHNDPRAILTIPPSVLEKEESLLDYLTRFSDEQSNFEFIESMVTCPICFVVKRGRECVRFGGCGHFFCAECTSAQFKLQITEGYVDQVKCLGYNCQVQPTYGQVESLVSSEVFERYDQILLARSLNIMRDVVYCPRLKCQKAGFVSDDEENLAICLACGYSFCVDCRKLYHGAQPCFHLQTTTSTTTTQTKNNDEEAEKEECDEDDGEEYAAEAMFKKYKKGTREVREKMEKIYGRVPYFKLFFDEIAAEMASEISSDWVEENCKFCPECGAIINKDGGCDHMYCIECNTPFNWSGAQKLNQNSEPTPAPIHWVTRPPD